jgi:transposase-like protein
VDKIPVDPRLIKLMDVDLRIVLTWDADMTDIDLWVTEPSEEKCYYRHPDTTIGGHMSRDITDGYGPEEYILKKAMDGVYRIEANYFGSSASKLIGAVTLHLDLFTNYGRANEKHDSITLRLADVKETIKVGEITFEASAQEKKEFAPEEKIAILKRVLLDHEKVSGLCTQYRITSADIDNWSKTLFENGARAFQNGAAGQPEELTDKIRLLEDRINKKNEIIAELLEEKMMLRDRPIV